MKTKTKTAATLTVHRAAQMTTKGRNSIIQWLKRQIGFLQKHPKELGPRFTAKYLYTT